MTSATDELRAELTKRGVEWMPCAWEPQTETFYKNGDGVAFIATESTAQDGFLLRTDMAVSTEQAIASTLGAGTCHMSYNELSNTSICLACGWRMDGKPNYCPNCGRKVVDE